MGMDLRTEAGQLGFKSVFDESISLGRTADRFCSVFLYLNDVAEGGRTTFSNAKQDQLLTDIAGAFDALRGVDTPAVAGSMIDQAGGAASLRIVPRRGMAVVHFPTTTAEYGCLPDVRTTHESEPAVAPKFIAQQFIWSSPLDEAKAVINAYVHSLLSVAFDGEKARGRGGVLLVDPALNVQYAMPEDVAKVASCGSDFVGRLQQLVATQEGHGRLMILEIADMTARTATIWTVEREPCEGAHGSHYEPSLREGFSLQHATPID